MDSISSGDVKKNNQGIGRRSRVPQQGESRTIKGLQDTSYEFLNEPPTAAGTWFRAKFGSNRSDDVATNPARNFLPACQH